MTKQRRIELNQKKEKDQKKFANGKWSKSEHEKFLKGFFEYGKNWSEIQRLVKTRNLSQVRSHAQKYFVKAKQEEDESCQISIYSDSEDFIWESRNVSSCGKKKFFQKRNYGKEIVFEVCEKQKKQVSKIQSTESLLDIFKQAIQQQILQTQPHKHENNQIEDQCVKAGERWHQQTVRVENEKRLTLFESIYGKW